MANFFYLTLDTIPPASPTVTIDGGAAFATNQLVNLSIGTADAVTSGYQMLIWGNVDNTFDANVQSTEATSKWIAYNNSKQVKLSIGDGEKTINIKIRDDVHNASSQASDKINLDTSIPTVSVSNPDVNRISKNPGKNVSSFTFTSDKIFTEYKVKVVSATTGAESTGTTINNLNGSSNVGGTGTYPAGTPITVSINGADLELASMYNGNGVDKDIIKVFVKDQSGKWSA